jgi:hypothetical protein
MLVIPISINNGFPNSADSVTVTIINELEAKNFFSHQVYMENNIAYPILYPLIVLCVSLITNISIIKLSWFLPAFIIGCIPIIVYLTLVSFRLSKGLALFGSILVLSNKLLFVNFFYGEYALLLSEFCLWVAIYF